MDNFYDPFLAKSAEVRKRFRRTDFVHQKLMLRESLLMMIMFNNSPAVVRDELMQLADRHSRREVDIPAHMYTLWLEALCEAIEQHDPEFSPDLAESWKVAMKPGIELLISKY